MFYCTETIQPPPPVILRVIATPRLKLRIALMVKGVGAVKSVVTLVPFLISRESLTHCWAICRPRRSEGRTLTYATRRATASSQAPSPSASTTTVDRPPPLTLRPFLPLPSPALALR